MSIKESGFGNVAGPAPPFPCPSHPIEEGHNVQNHQHAYSDSAGDRGARPVEQQAADPRGFRVTRRRDVFAVEKTQNAH